MRYSIFAGGKRVRPTLVMAAHEACGGSFGDKKTLLAVRRDRNASYLLAYP